MRFIVPVLTVSNLRKQLWIELYILMLNPMAHHATRAYYNTLGSYSGNQGNDNAIGSNNISIEVHSGTDTGARNQCAQNVIGAGGAGIIRILERYLIRN